MTDVPGSGDGAVEEASDEDAGAAEPQKLPFEVVRARRAGARLAAVQALYQLDLSGASARVAVRQFMEDRLGIGPDEQAVEEADPDLFKSVVEAAVEHQELIDAVIRERLSTGWTMSRLDGTVRAILRGATAELIAHPELSKAILVSEYTSLARDFFDGKTPGFVSGVLNGIGHELRPDEARTGKPG